MILRGQNILKNIHNFFNPLFFWKIFRNSSIMLLVAPNFSAFISKNFFSTNLKIFYDLRFIFNFYLYRHLSTFDPQVGSEYINM